MQTFLPYPSFIASARALDWRRLGCQRKEADQILYALIHGSCWSKHPATKMWAGYGSALMVYRNTMIKEWIRRGRNNNMKIIKVGFYILPWWIGNKEFHLSHKSNLVRKLPEHYRKLWPNVPDDLPYIWPEKDFKFSKSIIK